MRKAWDVAKVLRDAQPPEQAPEPPQRLSYLEIFGPLENKIADLATVARLVA